MLFEKRIYTLRPGCTSAFWQAQRTRGFTAVKPIMERLVGYFHTPGGPREQVIHLYCYDNHDDWSERLHGLYKVPALQAYFSAVRPLMLSQENEFIMPGPLPSLNPLWGSGQGPATRPSLGDDAPALSADILVEQTSHWLQPGHLPAHWDAWHRHDLSSVPLSTERLIGTFVTTVGMQHKITTYRWHRDRRQRDQHTAALDGCTAWQAFLQATSSGITAREHLLLSPAPIEQLSPLFPAHR